MATQHRLKARGNGEGSIYQRSDGKWCAAVSRPGGKRKVLYGRTRKEVADKLTALLRDVQQGLPLANHRLTTARLLMEWLENTVRPNHKPHTYNVYEAAIRRHLVPALGNVPAAKLTPQHVQALQAALAAKGLKPASVVVIRSVLSAALAQAVKWELVSRNVVQLTDMPRREQKDPRFLSSEQAGSLFAAAEGHEFEHLYALLLATGLRIGEALGLQWSAVQLDLNAPVLHVRQQSIELPNHGRKLADPKSNTGRRTVPLIGAAQAALRAQRRSVAAMRLRAGALWKDNDLVFPDPLGDLLAYKRAAAEFERVCKRAGFQDHYTLHALRHSAGTYLTAVGVPDRVVMEILGHSSTAMTLRYQHVLSSMLEDAATRLDAVFPTLRAAAG